ncbi:D-galacturonic acid binding lectin [Plakobranchus ocellatus]|uniref:D-galacturonic acid binding lectin n=1 Tax=Plakobranchus ocellatus TaxID=259542 RepID=A0AAV4CTX8_9GAST|nr:D-galacturonic acid binding lectin [Plakobranchus ocellatus]
MRWTWLAGVVTCLVVTLVEPPAVNAGASDDDCLRVDLSSNGYRLFKKEIQKDRNIKSMTLVQKYSRSDCDLGESFGFNGDEAFVDKGCRGKFKICLQPEDEGKDVREVRAVQKPRANELKLSNKHKLPTNNKLSNKHKLPTNNKLRSKHKLPTNNKLRGKHKLPTNNKLRGKHKLPTNNKLRNKHKLPTNNKLRSKHKLPTNNKLRSKHKLPTNNKLRSGVSSKRISCSRSKRCLSGPSSPPPSDGDCLAVDLSSNGYRLFKKEIQKDRNIKSMALIQKYSRSDCDLGESFGFNGDEAFVDKGCRGKFRICLQPEGEAPPPSDGDCLAVDLSSNGYRLFKKEIQKDRNIKSMALIQKYSRSDCDLGESFGFNGDEAFVDKGCRGKFRICLQPEGEAPPPSDGDCLAVDLSSNGYRLFKKEIQKDRNIKSMTLVQKYSRSDCDLGESFGFNGDEAFVDKGCRGKFRICLQPEGEAPPPSDSDCLAVDLSSNGYRLFKKEIRKDRNIKSMALIQKYSRSDCDLGESFGFNGDEAFVDKGCRGKFRICLQPEGEG